MNRILDKIVNTVMNVYRQANPTKKNLPRLWFGTSIAENGTSEQQLKDILRQNFPEAKVIDVQDVSGGCGEMYTIYIESANFKGVSTPKQHRAVYTALKEQIKLIHGLHVVTKVPP